MLQKDRIKPAKILGGAGAGLPAARDHRLPRRGRASPRPRTRRPATAPQAASPDRFAGHNLCHFQADRSRVTVSPTNDVPLDWTDTGCINAPHPICPQRRRLEPDPRPQWRADVSVLRIPAGDGRICRHPLPLDAGDHGPDPRAPARRRRQGLHAPTPRRARSSPTSSATSPRCCRTCPTNGWSMPARIRARRRAPERRCARRLRDSRAGYDAALVGTYP